MASKLSNLKVVEVSVVPQGANKQEFLILKEDVLMAGEALEKALKEAGLDGKLPDAIAKALEGDVYKGMSEKAVMAIKTAGRMLAAAKEDLPADCMQKVMAEAGMGYPAPVAAPAAPAPVAAPAAPVIPGVPTKKEDGSWDYSSVPEAVRPMVQALWKDNQDKEDRIAKAEAEVLKERDARLTKEFKEEASVYKNLGVSADDLGKVLKDLSEKAPEAAKLVRPMLKGIDERLSKSGLTTEVGATGGGAPVAVPGQTEAEGKIEQIAKGMVEKDGKMNLGQARAAAWQKNPELYTQHEAERARR